MEITSLHNPLVRAAAELKQKKYRLQRQMFLAEGLRTVEEAVRGGAARTLFYTAADGGRALALLEHAAAGGVELVCVAASVLQKLADTETPQGCVAVCGMRAYTLEQLLRDGKMLLVLDRVGDPGNVGTILRTADAAGMGGVVLLSGSADVYAPKTVRASMGSLFHLPVLGGVGENDFLAAARQAGYALLVTAAQGGRSLYRTDLGGRLAVVVGNEAGGVSSGLSEAADHKVFIPMRGRAESLNVAMAAGIVMFEALRRQLQDSPRGAGRQ